MSSEEQPVEDEEQNEQPATSFSLSSRISAILLASSRPVSASRIAKILERGVETVEETLEGLCELYDDSIHGFSLKNIAGKWQLRTAPGLSPVLRRLHPPKSRRLSRAAAETLSVIAYKQPVHRADIESVRGVDALPTLKTLLDAKLVRVVGKEDTIGNPALYGTTETFLEKFGLTDLSALPTLSELERIENDPGESQIESEDEVELDLDQEALSETSAGQDVEDSSSSAALLN